MHRDLDKFLPPGDRHLIAEAITAAERLTSGEICVHVTPRCHGNVMHAAERAFNRLQLYRTLRRNAVLIYIAYGNRKLAILGDTAINDVVPDGYWDAAMKQLASDLAGGNATEGICRTVATIGDGLAQYFPAVRDDVNELSNEVTYDNGEEEE